MYVPPDKLEKLKNDFDLLSYLLGKGFKFYPRDSSSNQKAPDGFQYRVLKLKEGGSSYLTFTLTNLSSGRYVYANLHDNTDKGSIIDYLINHENKNFQECLKFLINTHVEFKDVNEFIAYDEANESTSRSKINILKVEPFQYDKYYEKRFILTTIFKYPFIKESLAKIHYTSESDSPFEEDKTFYTHGFKIRDSNFETSCYNLRSTFHEDGLFTGPRNKGIWYAIKKPFDTVIIGESAIDVISYYRLHAKQFPNPMLVSSEGRYSRHYGETLKTIIGKSTFKNPGIVLVNDNDSYGLLYDFCWMIDYLKLPLTVGRTKNPDNNEIFLVFKTENSRVIKILEEYHDQEKDRFLVPITAASRLFQLLISTEFDVQCHKSKQKDWNEELKLVLSNNQSLSR